MRIILDTNVLIAAFAAHGLCHSVFELCVDQHEIILSEQILSEVTANLEKKLYLPTAVIHELTQYLRDNTSVENVQEPVGLICRDRSDDWVLALAKQTNADYIVTGDHDLLMLEKYGTTPIIQPRRLWEILNKRTK